MTAEEWRKRHADKFTYNGRIGGKLIDVEALEVLAGNEIMRRFPRQRVLMDAFMGFLVETTKFAGDRVWDVGWPPHAHYAVALAYFANIFRRLRSCEILFLSGYSSEGYALMRDVKDSVSPGSHCP